ncbi:hypothetical protein OIU34_01950 [Pararhizobium sp. BT-229]|uniref:hypothetical protein n=1 Tax=Pararhizobium sp. BT-229 TaxID=2986923 RepID=UPI0021F72B3C|nr:hypothetical protein [Pararhizobium sp. BT-229]MCV9960648.1 hypothetical protein [Pararhizobium sp. BT-229]
MKRALYFCSAAVLGAFLSSCTSVHPLPEDVTDNTVTIVNKIRCEARGAVIQAIIAYLEKRDDQRDRQFAATLKADERALGNLIRARSGKDISKQSYDYLNRYYYGAIGYDFKLDIERETNNAVSFSLIDAFRNHDRRFDIGAGQRRVQQATRDFRILDEFKELATLRDCGGKSEVNIAYPIAGRIGLAETVSTFLALNDLAGLQENKETSATKFTDQLLFTTTLTGRVNPKLVFDPVGIGDTNPEFGLTNEYRRTDKHQVTVSIEVPTKVPSAAAVPDARPAKRQVEDNLNTKRGQDALDALILLENRLN